MMDEIRYKNCLEKNWRDYEGLCRRCGACCGALDTDPCQNLLKMPDSTYACKTYDARLGVQKTVSGRIFTCVPIKNVLKFSAAPEGCAYR